jgi:hypothetical protein
MKHFWLGKWASSGDAQRAVEVLRDDDGDERFIVLISDEDRLDEAQVLICHIGFSNDPKACNRWRSRGFPMVDATIVLAGERLDVYSAYFSRNEESMQYGKRLLSIEGVRFEQAADSAPDSLETYRQLRETPQPFSSATRLLQQHVRWDMGRSHVKKAGAGPQIISATPVRLPSLAQLGDKPTNIPHAWTGLYEEPGTHAEEPGTHAVASATRSDLDRGRSYPNAAFRFSDIEVLAIRIELGQHALVQAGLNEWIEPLNFPPPRGSHRGFKFQVASTVIQVILLRYGRMETVEGESTAGYQSQHELVVRLLVGKVDAGRGGKVYDLAVHTPAIFVDNTWSKVIGRDLQGFEKCLADFCVTEDTGYSRLNPDGGLAGGAIGRPLSDITRIVLVDRASNDAMSHGQPLLDIVSPPDQGNWNKPQRSGTHMLMALPDQKLTWSLLRHRVRRLFSSSHLSQTKRPAWPGWRPGDLGGSQWFSDSLEDERLWRQLSEFDSIQATPVDDRGLAPAWISAVCKVKGLTSQLPSDGGDANKVKVTFYAPDSAPRGWQKLYGLLGPDNRTLEVADWYRSKFSMDLTGQDDLYGGHSDN